MVQRTSFVTVGKDQVSPVFHGKIWCGVLTDHSRWLIMNWAYRSGIRDMVGYGRNEHISMKLTYLKTGKMDFEFPVVNYEPHVVIPPNALEVGFKKSIDRRILYIKVKDSFVMGRVARQAQRLGIGSIDSFPHVTVSHHPEPDACMLPIDFAIHLYGERVTPRVLSRNAEYYLGRY
jgi:hypothetical protein